MTDHRVRPMLHRCRKSRRPTVRSMPWVSPQPPAKISRILNMARYYTGFRPGSEEKSTSVSKSIAGFRARHRSRLRQEDDIVLAHLLDGLPGALEAGRDDEAVAGLERPALACFIGQHRLAGNEVAELPLLVVDVGLA